MGSGSRGSVGQSGRRRNGNTGRNIGRSGSIGKGRKGRRGHSTERVSNCQTGDSIRRIRSSEAVVRGLRPVVRRRGRGRLIGLHIDLHIPVQEIQVPEMQGPEMGGRCITAGRAEVTRILEWRLGGIWKTG